MKKNEILCVVFSQKNQGAKDNSVFVIIQFVSKTQSLLNEGVAMNMEHFLLHKYQFGMQK